MAFQRHGGKLEGLILTRQDKFCCEKFYFKALIDLSPLGPEREVGMKKKFNQWEKIKSSIENIDVEDFKEDISSFVREVQRLASDSSLAPEAKKYMKRILSKYKELNRKIVKSQKQLEREFNRGLRKLQTSRQEATKTMKKVRTLLDQQKEDLLSLSKTLRERVDEKVTSKIKQIKKKKGSSPSKPRGGVTRKKTKKTKAGSTRAKKTAASKATARPKKATGKGLRSKATSSPRATPSKTL